MILFQRVFGISRISATRHRVNYLASMNCIRAVSVFNQDIIISVKNHVLMLQLLS